MSSEYEDKSLEESPQSKDRPEGYSGDEGLKKLGQLLSKRGLAGLNDRKEREERWDRGKSFYLNIPAKRASEDLPYDGASDQHLNIVQVVVDNLGTHVVGTLTSQEPYCQATLPTADEQLAHGLSIVQKATWFFCQRGRLKKALRSVAKPAGWSNAGHLTVAWEGDRPSFKVHEPDDAVVYPAVEKELSKATLYGTAFYRRKSEVEEFQKDGVYLPGKVTGYKDPGAEKEDKYPSVQGEIKHTPAVKGDEMCKLHRVSFKDDGGEKWWATVSFSDYTVLKIDKVPEDYLDCNLFKFGFKDEPGSGYWDKGSVVNDVQGGQLDCNELLNLLFDGIRMNSYGTVFKEAWAGATTEGRFGPGQIVSGQGMGTAQPYNPRADLTYVPVTMWQLKDHQNEVARVSNMGAGGQLKSGATATEAGGVLSGQQAGVNEYISVFGEPLEGCDGLFAYVQRLLYVHWEDWIGEFGEILGVDDSHYELFKLPIEWELSASTPSATPQAQIQAIQTLVPMSGEMPGLGLNQYALGAALVENLQKMGVLGAGKFQYPEDPMGLLTQLAMKTGIPPQYLQIVVAHAKLQFDELQRQQQGASAPSPGPQGQPGMDSVPRLAG